MPPVLLTPSLNAFFFTRAIALQRRLFERSTEVHRGTWNKSAAGSHEVRGTTLGIVGYGRIGSQVSILAELMGTKGPALFLQLLPILNVLINIKGLRVIFYDPVKRLPLGNAVQASTLDELLQKVHARVYAALEHCLSGVF